MTPDHFNRRAAAYQINSDIHRTTALAGIGLMVLIGLLGGFVLTWEHQLKREALEQQEARATWTQ